MTTQTRAPLDLSIVIPVYNEEAIVTEALQQLMGGLRRTPPMSGRTWEIIVSANGCVDDTIPRVRALMEDEPRLQLLESDEPNYGLALREGIRAARGTLVICDEIDLGDLDFYTRAIASIEEGGLDLVVGSKRLRESNDERPLFRRVASSGVTTLLRVATGFEGTDTHGLKAFRRQILLPVVERCIVDKDMFASEFVVRAHQNPRVRAGEIPVLVREKRPPSIRLMRRVPAVLRQLVVLAWVTRREHLREPR